MMLDDLRWLHRANREMWSGDTCRIDRWEATTGTWSFGAVDLSCDVQQGGSSLSSSDEDMASVEEQRSIRVYLAPEVVVVPGDRVRWRGRMWDVTSVDGTMRSRDWGTVLTCMEPQSGVRAEPVVFRRRVGGGWMELGEFEVRFTRSVPVTTSGATEGSASGGAFTAALVGGPEMGIVEVGDWFGRDGMPGRITRKDDNRPDHIEFTYVMEVVVP